METNYAKKTYLTINNMPSKEPEKKKTGLLNKPTEEESKPMSEIELVKMYVDTIRSQRVGFRGEDDGCT